MSAKNSSNEAARDAWESNAPFWDEQMGEGNAFVEVLVWPATTRLLAIEAGERVLDVACGNGLTSRRLAGLGARVVAIDFSEAMIARARRRTRPDVDVEYAVVDATDAEGLLAMGAGTFDAVSSSMALFDMAEIGPLFGAVARLLRPSGRFVFSVLHPCFNNPFTVHGAELEDRSGELVTTYSVKIPHYMTSTERRGLAIPGQPTPHPCFHRALTDLFGPLLAAGLVLDGFEERAFPPDFETGTYPLSWSGNFSEIPPVLVVRARLGGDRNASNPGP